MKTGSICSGPNFLRETFNVAYLSPLCIKEMPSWMQIAIKIYFSLKVAAELQSV